MAQTVPIGAVLAILVVLFADTYGTYVHSSSSGFKQFSFGDTAGSSSGGFVKYGSGNDDESIKEMLAKGNLKQFSFSKGSHSQYGDDNAYLKGMVETKMRKGGKMSGSADFQRWMSSHAGSLKGEGGKSFTWSHSWSSGGSMKSNGGMKMEGMSFGGKKMMGGGMKGMKLGGDMKGMKFGNMGNMKGMQFSNMGKMKGMQFGDIEGMKFSGQKGMEGFGKFKGMKMGDFKGMGNMKISGQHFGSAKYSGKMQYGSMQMSGMKFSGMSSMKMSGMKMSGMKMSGMKMSGMKMSGMKMRGMQFGHMSGGTKAGMMFGGMEAGGIGGMEGEGKVVVSGSKKRKERRKKHKSWSSKSREKNKRKKAKKSSEEEGEGCHFADNDYCYILSSRKLSFSRAEKECQKLHGHLAKIDSEDVQHKLSQFTKQNGIKDAIWFGLYQKRDDWMFADKTRLQTKGGFVNWDKNEPNNIHVGGKKGADCAIVYPDTNCKWRDRSCDADYMFVCQTPLEYFGKGKGGSSEDSSEKCSGGSSSNGKKGCKDEETDDVCPEGSFSNSDNKRCYKFYDIKMAWQEAYQYCLNEGGNLVIFDNAKTVKFLSKKVKSDIWISYTDKEDEGDFMLHYGETAVPTEITFFKDGQPNGGREQNCLMGTGKDKLKAQDKQCSESHSFVCEFRKRVDAAVDFTRVCTLRAGYRLDAEHKTDVDDVESVDKCVQLCDRQKTCLGCNFFAKKKKCQLLSDNIFTVEKGSLKKDKDCTFGGHNSRGFAHCPREADIRNPKSGICYQHYEIAMNWHDAQAECGRNGGHLAIIDNDDTYEFIKKNSEGFEDVYFIGFNDLDFKGKFYWQWNDLRVPCGKTFWKDKQPNDPDQEQNCGAATANADQKWQDKPCNEKRQFLCQYPPKGYIPDADWMAGYDKYENLRMNLKETKYHRENVDVETCARRCFQRGNCLAFDYHRNKKACRFLLSSKFTQPDRAKPDKEVDHYVVRIRQYAHCPEGCVKLPKSDRCFKIHDEEATWETAAKNCQRGKYAGNLVIMDNDDVFGLFQSVKKRFKKSIWTGCNKQGSRDFSWDVFGNKEKIGKFQKWKGGKAGNDAKKRCVRARNDDLEWEPEDCNAKHPYVCEYRPAGAAFTEVTDKIRSFQKFHGHRLEDPNLEIIENSKDVDCAEKCSEDETCLSFNFNYETNQCEVSKLSRFTTPELLKKVRGYEHYVHKGRQFSHCPPGSFINQGSRRCYQIIEKKVSWDEGQAECEKIGGKLAVLPDRSTWKSLTIQWPSKSPLDFWIGMISDLRGDMKWRWGVKNFRVGKSFNNWEGRSESKHKKWFRGRREAMCGCARAKYLDWKLNSCGDRKAILCEFRAPGDEQVSVNCPEGWEAFGGMCYMLEKNKVGYSDADSICKLNGAELVSIGSQAENEFLGDMLRPLVGRDSTPIWIGFNDIDTEKKWVFSDGTDWENGYQNWEDPQDPFKEDDDDCGAVVPRGSFNLQWKDRSCSSKYYYMCEAKPTDIKEYGCRSGNLQCPHNAECATTKQGSICVCENGYTAVMQDGELVGCSKASVCHGDGDPHYTTFDGYRIHFQGTCRYTLAKPCDGDVAAEDMFNVTVQQEIRGNKRSVAWIKAVYVEAYGEEIALLKDRQLKINGDHRHPGIELAEGKITTEMEGCRTVVVTLVDLGVRISFSNNNKIRIVVPTKYFSKMCGICGNYNDERDDDKYLAYTNQAGDYFEIGNSWLTSTHPDDLEENSEEGHEDCTVPSVPVPDDCTDASKAVYRSDLFCGWLLRDIFASCHAVLDPENFIENCVFDLCAGSDIEKTLCQHAETYSTEATQLGADVAWREGTPCAPLCPENSQYKASTSACPDSCENPEASLCCRRKPTEGCECNPGYLFSGTKCVLSTQCGCRGPDRIYRQAGDVWTDGRCHHKYTCQENGKILTEDISCHETASCKRNKFGKQSCHCQKGYEGDGITSCTDINECKQKRNPCGRDAKCENTPGSYKCTLECDPGYEESRGRCKDINECRARDKGGCSHICVNLRGTYKCKCPVGMDMGEDKKTCKAPKDCSEGVDLSDVEPALEEEPYSRRKPKKDWLKILKVRPARKVRRGSSSSESDESEEKPSKQGRKSRRRGGSSHDSGHSSSHKSGGPSSKGGRKPHKKGGSSHDSGHSSSSESEGPSSERGRKPHKKGGSSHDSGHSSSHESGGVSAKRRKFKSDKKDFLDVLLGSGGSSHSSGGSSHSGGGGSHSGGGKPHRKRGHSHSSGEHSHSSGGHSHSNGRRSHRSGRKSHSSSGRSSGRSGRSRERVKVKLELLAKLRGENRDLIEKVFEKEHKGGKKDLLRGESGWKKFNFKSNGNDEGVDPAKKRQNQPSADRDWIKSPDECVAAPVSIGEPVIKGDGFKLNPKSGKCQDIDECSTGTHKCPAGSNCKNTIGSYTCQCHDGNLVDIKGKLVCQGWSVCSGSGDPHYYTFDGIKINYMGTCTYTLVKPCPVSRICDVPYFNVEVKNWHKPGRNTRVSYTRYVTVDIANARIKLGPGKGNVYISSSPEEEGTLFYLPVTNHPDLPGVEITQRGRNMMVKSDFLLVLYDGDTRVKVSIPNEIYKNIGMCGLCGNFNGEESDDLLDRFGEDIDALDLRSKEKHAIVGDSWRVENADWEEGCKAPPDNEEECPTEMARNLVLSDSMCGMISDLNGPFADCIGAMVQAGHEKIIEELVDSCYYDLCMDYENKERELCEALSDLNSLCVSYGVTDIGFRTEDFCPMKCKENMVFQRSMSACTVSCSNPNMDPNNCPYPNEEGCACMPGLIRSGEDCVKPAQCGCFDMERGYIPVDESFVSSDCSTIRTCQVGGNFHDSPTRACHALAKCTVRKGVRGCHCKKGYRNGDGINNCDNEDECADGSHRCSKNAVCMDTEGSYECTCRSGFVGDGKICIPIPECVKGFTRNAKGECEDINECQQDPYPCGPNAKCHNSRPGYQCSCKGNMAGDPYSESGCHGACVCRTSGDPHFSTCDGLSYDFQGRCKYTLAKPCGENMNLPNFQVDIKNSRWRNSQASRVEYVDVAVCGYVVRLHQGNVILVNNVQKRAPVELECDDGHTVKVELVYNRRCSATLLSTDFGVSLKWDGHWDVDLKISDTYAGKLCGLCGNFDGVLENDPQIQGAGIDEGEKLGHGHEDDEEHVKLYNKFAESWRVESEDDESCESDDTAEPVCTKERYRQARGVCKVLADRRGEFSMCVAALGKRAARAALKDCAFDYCMTPDDSVQQTLCNDLEEYVAACEGKLEQSLDFDWRAKFKCPSMCPGNMEFKKDVSGCPKTCDNPEGSTGCTQPNRDACVCKDGMVLLGGSCVDLAACSCVDDHNNFRARDEVWVTDKCAETCTCTNHGVDCEDGPKCVGDKQSCGRSRFGVWGCVCDKGFEMNEDGACENIDECHRHIDNCHPNAECTDKSPSFECKCKEGYSGDGVKCKLDKPDPVCIDNGKTYKLNEVFNRTPCEQCTCVECLGDPEVTCTMMSCPALSSYCLEETTAEGECCPTCAKEGCIDMNGDEKKIDEMFFPEDVCNMQVCGEERVREVQCDPLPGDCDTVITPEGECCSFCDFGSPPPPPSGCPVLSCPTTMGWELREMPVRGDTRLQILQDKTFDCPGIINRVEYYRSEPEGIVYLGVLRPVGDKLRVVSRVTLYEEDVGINTVELDMYQAMPVKRGDILAVWYPRDAVKGVLSLADASDEKFSCFGGSSCIPGGLFAYTTDAEVYDLDIDDELQVGSPNARRVLPILVHIESDRMKLSNEVKLSEEKKTFKCSSRGYQYAECEMNGYPMELKLARQLSRSDCVEGVSYGIKQTKIWVDKGCRAKFKVDLCRVSSNCGEGYEFDAKRGKCRDINECKKNRKICDRGLLCSNTEGSYKCLAYCGISGDPHYYTFDGTKLTFQGMCVYQLVKPCPVEERKSIPDFDIRALNEADENNEEVSWVKNLYVQIGEYNFVIKAGPVVMINDQTSSLQFTLTTGGHTITGSLRGTYFYLETSFDLTVAFDTQRKRIKILLPEDYKNIGMCGMCGNYDGDRDNDLYTSDGQYVGDLSRLEYSTAIGNSWERSDGAEACVAPPPPPCPAETENMLADKSRCGKMVDPEGPFADCLANAKEDVDNFYLQCLYDGCLVPDKMDDQVCIALSNLYDICIGFGYVPTWKKQENCPVDCGENEEYMADREECEESCLSLVDSDEECVDNAQEGCFCVDGFVRSGLKCVDKASCGCSHMGVYYQPNEEVVTCDKKLKCTNHKMEETSAPHECGKGETCKMANDKPTCVCDEANQFYMKDGKCVKTTCEEGQTAFRQNCYEVPDDKKPYNPGREYCFKKGGQMVIITDQELNDFVKGLLKDKNVKKAFIGLDDQLEEGRFVWSNNQRLRNGDFTKWEGAGPAGDRSVDDCARMDRYTGEWRDVYCSLELPFVCEYGPFTPGILLIPQSKPLICHDIYLYPGHVTTCTIFML